jgi:predicted esterase
MELHNLSVTKTARYYTIGKLTEHTEHILFALHGYGQSIDKFIGNFIGLDDGKTFIVAPEGLHRFYLKGGVGEVGASWMTKVDRSHDIRDYIQYLNLLYSKLLNRNQYIKAQIHALGFSQGTATACRWVFNGESRIQDLILWGGLYPPETDFGSLKGLLDTINVRIVVGDRDPFININSIKKQLQILSEIFINYNLVEYEGTHEIKSKILADLLNT